MTLNSTTLLARIREFCGRNTSPTERVDALVLGGTFASAEEQAAWLELSHSVPRYIREIHIYDAEVSGDLNDTDPFDADRRYNITIVKQEVDGVCCLFFQNSLDEFLKDTTVPAKIIVADLPAEANFRARGLEVSHWSLEDPIEPAPEHVAISPSKLVSDYVPKREIVTDLAPWILLTGPVQQSSAFSFWKTVGARRLLGGVVASASLESGVVWFQVSGPPIYRVQADDPAIPISWETLTDVVEWIFLSGSDVEARHRLFTGELARAVRPGQDFPTTLQRALEAAKVAYEAHIQSSSRETLKALADLRKTVIEETQKVTQRAQDMTASLWRDLAVSSAPFVIKILGDAGRVLSPWVSAAFYFVAAFCVGLSFFLQWRINKAFFRSQKNSRRRWMQTLYTYISVREREEIAEEPIEQAMKSYRETRRILLIVYALLVAMLIVAGIYVLSTPPVTLQKESVAPVSIVVPVPTPTPTPTPTPASVQAKVPGPDHASSPKLSPVPKQSQK